MLPPPPPAVSERFYSERFYSERFYSERFYSERFYSERFYTASSATHRAALHNEEEREGGRARAWKSGIEGFVRGRSTAIWLYMVRSYVEARACEDAKSMFNLSLSLSERCNG